MYNVEMYNIQPRIDLIKLQFIIQNIKLECRHCMNNIRLVNRLNSCVVVGVYLMYSG